MKTHAWKNCKGNWFVAAQKKRKEKNEATKRRKDISDRLAGGHKPNCTHLVQEYFQGLGAETSLFLNSLTKRLTISKCLAIFCRFQSLLEEKAVNEIAAK